MRLVTTPSAAVGFQRASHYSLKLLLKCKPSLANTIGSETPSRSCSTAYGQYPLKGISDAKARPSCPSAKPSHLLTDESASDWDSGSGLCPNLVTISCNCCAAAIGRGCKKSRA
ncbi:MAG: hypothetical protein FRX49_08477 [Trebouxia sp. A1-2]|nr:MAG: hypothetical protein FRX49_08477 [Trebouxia sp. A1-2]